MGPLFIYDGWLIEDRSGNYLRLGHRAVLELEEYFVKNFEEDVLECTLCNQIVLQGLACPQERCGKKMHLRCGLTFWKTQAQTKCIICTNEWALPKSLEKWLVEYRNKERQRKEARLGAAMAIGDE